MFWLTQRQKTNESRKLFRTVTGLCLSLAFLACPQAGWTLSSNLKVTSLGLSRVGDTTYLTVMASRLVDAKVTPQESAGKNQLVVEFPTASSGRLPAHLAGDDILVKEVRTETTAPQGVRIILEILPERSYSFWRKGKILPNGNYAFVVGLKPELTTRRQEPTSIPRTASAPTFRPNTSPEGHSPASLTPPAPVVTASGPLGELKGLIPKAAPLLQFLETDGWTLDTQEDYDRPGKRFSRGFFLSNPKHPEMIIKIAYLPANTPGAPNISMITLSMEKLPGQAAADYQQLRHWSFAQIKSKYEDIGDFFDDALKPLRVQLRQQCQEVARREEVFLRRFASQAFPDNPQAAERLLRHIQEKINPRFEGVQYTISEDPLGILNLVDFLFVRAYYLDYHPSGGHG